MRLRLGVFFSLSVWLASSVGVPAAAEEAERPQQHHERAVLESVSGHWGAALAELRRTETLTPWNPEVQANLRIARGKLEPPISNVPIPGWVASPLNAIAGTLLGLVWLGGALVVGLRVRAGWEPWLRWPKLLVALATAVAAVLLGGSALGRRFTPDGVIVVKDAVLHQGPVDAAKAQGTLAEGAEVRILREHRGWYEVGSVRPGSPALGWLAPGQLAPVAPPWWP